MGDRLYDDLEIALSSYSIPIIDDYNEEEEETEEEYEGEEVNDVQNEEKSEELACPFCLEDFDVLGLCCHIDADHRMEVKPRICPVCAAKVGINMASHKYRSTRSRSAIFLLRKELQEKHLRCIKESPCVDSSSDAAADSMLLSFVNNPEPTYRPQTIEAISPTEKSLSGQSSADDSSKRYAGNPLFLSRFQYYCTELEVNGNMISELVYCLLYLPFGT
ncbi:UNVERIFIED_CONTAM: Protein DEHYDRATION-INDUCED 19 [Sesamum indicum]